MHILSDSPGTCNLRVCLKINRILRALAFVVEACDGEDGHTPFVVQRFFYGDQVHNRRSLYKKGHLVITKRL